MSVTADFLYSGFPDYWSGDSDRWDDNNGCLFAYYGARSTLRDIVDSAVNDFCAGGDCDTLHEDVTEEDIRAALLGCLSPAGLADYESGALSEFAQEYADANDFNECRDCGEAIGNYHDSECPRKDYDVDGYVTEEDCDEDDEYGDSPVCIFLIKTEVCSRCGKLADHYVDDICEDCYTRDWEIGDEVITEVCTDDDGKPCDWYEVRGVITKIDDNRALIDLGKRTVRRGREDFWN